MRRNHVCGGNIVIIKSFILMITVNKSRCIKLSVMVRADDNNLE